MREPPGEPGAGDRCVQAYNFRLCLTNNPANRLPIKPPADAPKPKIHNIVVSENGSLFLNGDAFNLAQLRHWLANHHSVHLRQPFCQLHAAVWSQDKNGA